MPEALGPGGAGGVPAVFGLEQAANEGRVRRAWRALLRDRQKRPHNENQEGVQRAAGGYCTLNATDLITVPPATMSTRQSPVASAGMTLELQVRHGEPPTDNSFRATS